MTDISTLMPLSSSAREVLHQLFINGPTWDGDIVSKPGRGDLFKRGLSDRVQGFAFLTRAGMELAVGLYKREKS